VVVDDKGGAVGLNAWTGVRFPSLEFEVLTVALDAEQAPELGLPSTPLKETERRADNWRESHRGLEQTHLRFLPLLTEPMAQSPKRLPEAH
jgi:hypothetical protein